MVMDTNGSYFLTTTTTNRGHVTEETNTSQIYLDPEQSPHYVFTRRVQTVLIPPICLFGFVANMLAARTFLCAALRTSSCSLYLATKCMVDNLFLISLFVVWLYRVGVPLMNVEGFCQLTVFLTYACAFLSVWFVAVITCENYIRIAHPTRVATCCTAARARTLITIMCVIAIVLYSFPLWTSRVTVEYRYVASANTTNTSTTMVTSAPVCNSLSDHAQLVITMTYVDTAVTLVLPSVIITIMVLVIVQSVLRSLQRRKRLRAGTQRAPGVRRNVTPQTKMTRFLFAISVIFLVLNTPGHVIRLKMIIGFYGFHQQASFSDHTFQRLFELLSYLNYCNNCVVYLIFGDKFRQTFCGLFCSRFCCKTRSPRTATEEHSLVCKSDITEMEGLKQINGRTTGS